MGEPMRIKDFLAVALVVILGGIPYMVFGQPASSGRSDGLQFSDFLIPEGMKQVEARNLNDLLNKWTEKYCAQLYAGCAVPAQNAYDELLTDLQATSTMSQLSAWRKKASCVDRCVVDFTPPALEQSKISCVAGCSAGSTSSK